MKLSNFFSISILTSLVILFSAQLSAQDAVVSTVQEPVVKAAESPTRWNHESELGIVMNGGNTDSLSFNVAQKTTFGWSKNDLIFKTRFLYGTANDLVNARNWDTGLRYERTLSTRFALFAANNWESDTFAGFDYRAGLEAGGKYYFVPKVKEQDYFFSELGYKFVYENKIDGIDPPLTRSHFVKARLEGMHYFQKTISAQLWVEVLEDFMESRNVQINFEPSLLVVLSQNFSLKTAFLGKFDNIPAVAGNKKFDYIYTTALVANF